MRQCNPNLLVVLLLLISGVQTVVLGQDVLRPKRADTIDRTSLIYLSTFVNKNVPIKVGNTLEYDHTSFIYLSKNSLSVNSVKSTDTSKLQLIEFLPQNSEPTIGFDSTSWIYFYNNRTDLPEVSYSIESSGYLLNDSIAIPDVTSYIYANFVKTENLKNVILFSIPRIDHKHFYETVLRETEIPTQLPEEIPIEKKERKSVFPQWIIVAILFSLAIFAWSKNFYQKYLPSLFLSLINYRTFNRLSREVNSLTTRTSMALSFVYYLNLGLYVYMTAIYYQFNVDLTFIGYLIIVSVSIFYFPFRALIIYILGIIFEKEKMAGEYNSNLKVFNQAYGLVLFPVVIGIAYIKSEFAFLFIFLGGIFFILFYLLKIFRAVQIIFAKHFSFLYLILYLCTLEIFPVLVLLKYFNFL